MQGIINRKYHSYFIATFWFVSCLYLHFSAQAQTDSTKQVNDNAPIIIDESQSAADSVKMAFVYKRFNPQKALLYAAILPGAGQVYNKKYWKLPLVYGGFGFLGYAVDFYNDRYRFYRSELFVFLNTGSSTTGLPENSLRTITDRYRRERDFFIVLTGIMYALQIIDAHVDAHLKEFDVNPNLQVRIEPSMTNDILLGRQNGFTISIRF